MSTPSDEALIASWLHDRPANTLDAYRRDVVQFQAFVGKPLAELGLTDVQAYATHLTDRKLAETTRRRKLKAIKSLLNFAVEQQAIGRNPASAIRLKPHTPNLAGRILSREDVQKIITGAGTERDRLFLLVTYALGLRASEACALKWADFVSRSDGKTQVTVCGKGGKVASVLVPESVWVQLQVLRDGKDLLFPFTRRNGHDIIKRAVTAAGLNPQISLHWLRHALARHSIEAGAPINVVRDTLRHSSIAVTNWYLESFPDQSASDYLEF
jgi:integrase/recombinase XerD